MTSFKEKELIELLEAKPVKTYIAIVSSHDSEEGNKNLKLFLEKVYNNYRNNIKDYGFLFTGGTFHRIITGEDDNGRYRVGSKVKKFFEERSVYLPRFSNGGNTLLSTLIIEKKVSIIWSFFYPSSSHLSSFENRTLLRLCGVHHVKQLDTPHAIIDWIRDESERDLDRNHQPHPLSIVLRTDDKPRNRIFIEAKNHDDCPFLGKELEEEKIPFEEDLERMINEEKVEEDVVRWNVAICASGKLEDRLIEVIRDHEREFKAFQKLVTTHDFAKKLMSEIPGFENNLYQYHTNHDGGFIELATEVLFRKCNALIIFSEDDQSNIYRDDLRVLRDSAKINQEVRLIPEETDARDWLVYNVKPKRQEGLKKGAYKTGDICQVSGLYRFVRHVGKSQKCHKFEDNLLVEMTKGEIFPPIDEITDMIPVCGKPSYWVYNNMISD